MFWVTLLSFVLFTGFVAVGTWLIVRRRESSSQDGFFLAGRSLTFPFIAGSLLLTNLSTEQMVGLNGSAFKEGMSVIAWEVVAVIALVLMALWFLPKFLKAGITTVPEYLRYRFDETTGLLCNLLFLISYMLILLPIILYTGARGMLDILDLNAMLGIESEMAQLYVVVIAVAVIGSCYALFGGLNSCAVSDTLNGIGLLIGGFLISWFAFATLGNGEVSEGISTFFREGGDRVNSIGANDAEAPFLALFTGVLFINVFYWCTNQQIIQRTLGAKSLAEGQKGILLTGALKLLGPLYLVFPGMIAAMLYMRGMLHIPANAATGLAASDQAYGALVNAVLPAPLKGFFAAVLLGAILSSFNSALNSTCTLFSLDVYKRKINPTAPDRKVVVVGQIFGTIITLGAIIIAPLLQQAGSIFNYLQKMNAIYFIPILAVVLIAIMTRKVPAAAANLALVLGVILIGIGYFIPPFTGYVEAMGQYHFVACVLALMLVLMLVWGKLRPLPVPFEEKDAKVTDLTPWKGVVPVSAILIIVVVIIYAAFADFSVFTKGKPAYPTAPAAIQQTNP